jgi:hypothetical protein
VSRRSLECEVVVQPVGVLPQDGPSEYGRDAVGIDEQAALLPQGFVVVSGVRRRWAFSGAKNLWSTAGMRYVAFGKVGSHSRLPERVFQPTWS